MTELTKDEKLELLSVLDEAIQQELLHGEGIGSTKADRLWVIWKKIKREME